MTEGNETSGKTPLAQLIAAALAQGEVHDWEPRMKPGAEDLHIGRVPEQLQALVHLGNMLCTEEVEAWRALQAAMNRRHVVAQLISHMLAERFPTIVTPDVVTALKICKGWEVYGVWTKPDDAMHLGDVLARELDEVFEKVSKRKR